jgi:hypothetical protein
MPNVMAEICRKISRIFLGRIIVRKLGDLRRENPAKIETHFRYIEVKPLRVETRVGAAMFVKWKNTAAHSAGSLLRGPSSFRVEGLNPGVIRSPEVKRYKFNIKRRAAARHAMWKINRTPCQRRNRINFLKKPPKIERATLLALYSPIFQEKVAKSALDKSSGNLLFWYDNKCLKMGARYHLLLFRVFGGEEPLKWVWLPADKKIG